MFLKKIIKKIIHLINKLLYRKFNIDLCPHNQWVIFKNGFMQKILGFNKHIPWPVHYTSQIIAPEKIVIGNRTPGLSMNCFIDARNGIEFGENVWIGPRVSLISQDHCNIDYNNYIESLPIKIGKNSLLCANSIILPSVCLGEHTVVAAGAVVTKSFLDGNVILGGNPARIIKKIGPYESQLAKGINL